MTEPVSMFRSFQAMGTRFECVLARFSGGVSEAGAAAVAESIETLVLEEHHRLSLFEPHSELSQINRSASQQSVRIDPDLFGLLFRCLGYTQQTKGAFDITAGSLMKKFGFRSEQNPEQVAYGSHLVQLDANAQSVRFASTGVRFDLGGIAKGYALDLARDELIEQGVASAILHGGTSSATAVGSAPDGSPWLVRLMADDPTCPTIDLTGRSLACSSPAGRTVGDCGHIMDTRTGKPATGVEAACVVGPSAEVCEAWSTALVVAPDLIETLPSVYEAHILRSNEWCFFAQSSQRSPLTPSEALHHV
ncbi:MAG: FAD:protein FMN transferase [Planctomycetota bacterium]